MTVAITLSFLLVLGAEAQAESPDCAAETSTETLAATLDAAERAFERRQRAAVSEAAGEALAHLPCLHDAVTPDLAARLHRVEGLSAFLGKDEAGARRSFASARAAEPGYTMPGTFLPSGHPARVLYEQAAAPPASAEPIPPVEGSVHLDGRAAVVRPTDRPVILQHFDRTGRVDLSRYLSPTDPLPLLPAPMAVGPSPALPTPSPPTTSPGGSHQPRRGLLIASLGGLAASGVLYGAAGLVQGRYEDLPSGSASNERLASLYRTNHALVITAGLTATLSATGVGLAWLEGR